MSTRWPRQLTEGVVIVASILLAFGIDAAWEQRQERALERELLTSLVTEAEAALATLRAGVEAHQRHGDSIAAILQYSTGASTEPPSPISVFQVLLSNTTTHLEAGVIDGSIRSGSLALVRDSQLRAALAAWPRAYEEFGEEEVALFRSAESNRERLASELDMTTLSLTEPLPREFADFLRTGEARSLLWFRSLSEAAAIRDGEALQETTGELIGLLRDALGS